MAVILLFIILLYLQHGNSDHCRLHTYYFDVALADNANANDSGEYLLTLKFRFRTDQLV